MNERIQFVAAVTRGEVTIAQACRDAGVSRKTGYKWLDRYQQDGASGLVTRSHAALTHPRAVDPVWTERVMALRGTYPTWGPKKLHWKLGQLYPDAVLPAPSTLGLMLGRAGLVVARRRRAHTPPRTDPLAHADRPNVVWCADFKGDFLLGDGTRCYPLTITDAHSRLLLRCQALPTTSGERAQPLFAATFREYGLPDRIRTDNGVPFASVGAGGLSALSVWWVRLGIVPERIDPGQPSQNGRHERMHRTLKADAIAPPARTLAAQQRAFDAFRHTYNYERPHEAVGMAPPAQVYAPATRPYPDRLADLDYPQADAVRWVRPNGSIRWPRTEVYISQTLAGQPIGLTQVGPTCWQVVFGPVCLGYP